MIEKVKNFAKEHRRVFLVGSVLFAGAVTTAIVYSETKNKNSEDVTEKRILSNRYEFREC